MAVARQWWQRERGSSIIDLPLARVRLRATARPIFAGFPRRRPKPHKKVTTTVLPIHPRRGAQIILGTGAKQDPTKSTAQFSYPTNFCTFRITHFHRFISFILLKTMPAAAAQHA